jgi:hypothetical protein
MTNRVTGIYILWTVPYPTLQFVQASNLVPEKVPGWQVPQKALPPAENVPGPQSAQVVALTLRPVANPLPQYKQSSSAGFGENFPSGQSSQDEPLSTNSPGLHARHESRFEDENLPPTQSSHSTLPREMLTRPNSHTAHSRGHGGCVTLEKVPGEHFSHWSCAFRKYPGSQWTVGLGLGRKVGYGVGVGCEDGVCEGDAEGTEVGLLGAGVGGKEGEVVG